LKLSLRPTRPIVPTARALLDASRPRLRLVARGIRRATPRQKADRRFAAALPLAAAALLAAPSPAGAAQRHRRPTAPDMTLGPVVRTALRGCDSPTPVRAPDGGTYTNVSDCAVGGSDKLSTAWIRLEPSVLLTSSGVDEYGDGARGRKLSGTLVEGGKLYLIERNLTRSGGLRVGHSGGVSKPNVTWAFSIPDFGWASFAQASPDGYQYVYLRDTRTAYGPADRVDLARVPKGKVANLAAWEIFSGDPAAPAWLPWAGRAARTPIIADPGKVSRTHASYLGGCWVVAVTKPLVSGNTGGNGLAVYTSPQPFGPWNRRYNIEGTDMGETAQFSPLWPGQLLTSRGDRFEWRTYSMPAGC
jgi:hypothetical protein